VICWAIALGVIVGAASHYLQTPVYESGAQVLLQQSSSTQSLVQQPQNQIDPATLAASQVIVIRSVAVASAASAAIKGHPAPGVILSHVRVAVSPTSSVLTIIASSGDPAQAQQIANAMAKAYISNRYAFAVGNLRSAVAAIDPQLESLQNQIASLDTQISTAARRPGGSTGGLQAQRDAVGSQYQALFSKQEELKVDIQLTRSVAELASAAGLPGSPVTPKPRRDAELGAMAGLLIGLGIELLREKFGDKINTAEELERITSRPVLAEVPSDDAVAAAVSPAIVRPGEFPEAMRTLRTSLQFLGIEHPRRRIVVSSAGTGDGKTTIAANLAVAYAEAGFTTVLVSADLRRPQVETLFGAAPTELGLSTLLAGAIEARILLDEGACTSSADLLRDYLKWYDTMRPRFAHNGSGNGSANANGSHASYSVEASDEGTRAERAARITEFLQLQSINPAIENLVVIPGGPTPPNPAELLGSTRMREVLDVLAAHFEVIIIDTPPALIVTDSVVLSDASDGVLIVVSAEKSTRRDLKRLMAIYEAADVPVLGTVLNRAPSSRKKSSYYDAYYSAPRSERVSPLAPQK
jgi:Mrp family chromosome partitioning ATPase